MVQSTKGGGGDGFPTGMRVLAVDDDMVCLKLLETLLLQCGYIVTVAQHTRTALKLLRENKDNYDIVISDVQMPDMDGFKLLEIVGLEMDLPVIMLSVNSEVNTVMKGIMHGACDYLVKPVRLEELKIIWKHVIRKKPLHDTKEANDPTYKLDQIAKTDDDRPSKLTRKCKVQRKGSEDDSNYQSDKNHSRQKRPRVSWSSDLHSKFIFAVDQLGMVDAQPKKILDAMNAPELTRANVASHLQKFKKAMMKNGIGMGQQHHAGVGSDKFGGHPPSSVLLSFNEQGPCIPSLEAFKVNGYQNHPGRTLSGNAQYSRNGLSHVTQPWSLLPLKHHHNLLQKHASAPQSQTRTQYCAYGTNSLVLETYPQSEFNRSEYQSLSPRPSQINDCMENFSLNSWAGDKAPMKSSVTQLGHASNQQSINVLSDSRNPQHGWLEDRISNELNAILPMQHGQHRFGACTGSDLFVGAKNNGDSPDIQSSNKELFEGVSTPELVDHSLEHLATETMYHLNRFDSSDDLLTVLKQFQH